jgi:hypothetical protein
MGGRNEPLTSKNGVRGERFFGLVARIFYTPVIFKERRALLLQGLQGGESKVAASLAVNSPQSQPKQLVALSKSRGQKGNPLRCVCV